MLDKKLLVVSGKGGVGKSAVTASLSLAAAISGLKTLAIAMTDELGLAIHLRAEHLDYDPISIQPGLEAMAVDRPRAIDEYLKTRMRVPKAAPTRQVMRALNVVVETVPGVREVVTMGKPIYELWNQNYDLVVVDAPPLGQLFSYLRAPATIAQLVPAGMIREQAAAMAEALANRHTTGLVLVTTAEELPVSETSEALAQLEAEPVIDLTALVVNRLLEPLELDEPEVQLPSGPYGDAARLHAALYARQQEWLTQLPSATPLPFLFGLLTPGEVAARLSEEWTGAGRIA